VEGTLQEHARLERVGQAQQHEDNPRSQPPGGARQPLPGCRGRQQDERGGDDDRYGVHRDRAHT
jgi:hypothetical protein